MKEIEAEWAKEDQANVKSESRFRRVTKPKVQVTPVSRTRQEKEETKSTEKSLKILNYLKNLEATGREKPAWLRKLDELNNDIKQTPEPPK